VEWLGRLRGVLCTSSKCCIVSFIVISLGVWRSSLLSVGPTSARRPLLLTLGDLSSSALRVTILVTLGDGFFDGVASTAGESNPLLFELL
jgi:hypothetical protein